MTLLSINDLNTFLESHSPLHPNGDFINMFKNYEETAYDTYKELIDVQKHDTELKNLLEELKLQILKVNDLNQPEIQDWCIRTKDLYLNKLFGFAFHYFYFIETPTDPIYIRQLDVYVERKGFENVILFCDVQNILCWGEYYLPQTERTMPNPNDYYYTPPDPNAPKSIELVKRLLLI
jgi:hypothetical protein